MAIEAVRQVTGESQPSQKISNFILKHVTFSKALVIPESPGKVEMQLSLRSLQEGEVHWQHFRVSALSQEGSWHEHCQGMVRAEIADDFSDPDHDHNVD